MYRGWIIKWNPSSYLAWVGGQRVHWIPRLLLLSWVSWSNKNFYISKILHFITLCFISHICHEKPGMPIFLGGKYEKWNVGKVIKCRNFKCSYCYRKPSFTSSASSNAYFDENGVKMSGQNKERFSSKYLSVAAAVECSCFSRFQQKRRSFIIKQYKVLVTTDNAITLEI